MDCWSDKLFTKVSDWSTWTFLSVLNNYGFGFAGSEEYFRRHAGGPHTDSPVTSAVWSWSLLGPQIQERDCATSGTTELRLVAPGPSRTRRQTATQPGGSGAKPCSLSTTGRIVSTPPSQLEGTERVLHSNSTNVSGGVIPRVPARSRSDPFTSYKVKISISQTPWKRCPGSCSNDNFTIALHLESHVTFAVALVD